MSWRSGGVRTWVMQRLSAVYIAVFALLFLWQLFSAPLTSFEQWHFFIANPMVNISFIIFWLAIAVHGWIGARDVIMDYVHDDTLRFIVLSLMGLFVIFMTVWVVKTLIMVGM